MKKNLVLAIGEEGSKQILSTPAEPMPLKDLSSSPYFEEPAAALAASGKKHFVGTQADSRKGLNVSPLFHLVRSIGLENFDPYSITSEQPDSNSRRRPSTPAMHQTPTQVHFAPRGSSGSSISPYPLLHSRPHISTSCH